MPAETDVVIVGGGLAGLAAGGPLKRCSRSCAARAERHGSAPGRGGPIGPAGGPLRAVILALPIVPVDSCARPVRVVAGDPLVGLRSGAAAGR